MCSPLRASRLRALGVLFALTVQDFDELQRFLLHRDHERVHPPAEVAVEIQCGDRHQQAGRGRDQRLADAAGEFGGSPAPAVFRALNIWIMPNTVPSRPSNGDTAAMVPSVLR